MFKQVPVLVIFAAGLSGCALVERLAGKPETAAGTAEQTAPMATEIAAPVETTSLETLGGGQTPEALDQTSATEKAAALAAPAAGGERELGRAVVALGAPAEQGLWVQSELVKAVAKGRVVAPNGQSLAVDLRPGTGAALMSLAAYQALGIGLTELPELVIYGP
ncbi:hypothetical protein LHP98_04575 [Rhodobacter sp. Har01]|uniref:hypothetical protein n=1 Tax=Rhodobacter sp. Har01 TaxID=2883999 RepID=UPI001D089803|nr:hypothetical protein [Rhodobacter sp. Har01]MCB6177404.1 hypothetical protein [Rhodobacter sp. Har01]